MRTRFIVFMLLVFITLSCAGCSGTWRRKFVRAKKGDQTQGPVLQPYDYAREFTNAQLYANNYTFWRNSESELIKSIKSKDNIKRIKSYASQALVDIKKLYSLLVDEKAAGLEPYVQELRAIIEHINQAGYVSSNSNSLVSRLSKHYRAVSRNFSFYHMKNSIKPEQEDLDDREAE